jgi:hypothetical protein
MVDINDDAAMKKMANTQQKANEELAKAAAKDTDMCKNPRLHKVPKELEETFKKGVKLIDTLSKEGTLNCDEKCLYQKNKEKLKQDMSFAERMYKSAPKLLRDSQERYYTFTQEQEGTTYDMFQKKEVDRVLKKKIDQYQKRFNEYAKIVSLIAEESNETRKSEMKSHLQNLQTMHENEINTKENKLFESQEIYKIADRETYYLNESIVLFRTLNIITFIIYFACISLYFVTFLYVYQEYKSTTLVKTRLFRMLPFILVGIGGLLLYIYFSENKLFGNPNIDHSPENNIDSSINETENDPFIEDRIYADPKAYIEQQKDIIKRQKEVIQEQQTYMKSQYS